MGSDAFRLSQCPSRSQEMNSVVGEELVRPDLAPVFQVFLDATREWLLLNRRLRFRDLYVRRIIDEHGNRIATHTPPDMLDPDSSVEQ